MHRCYEKLVTLCGPCIKACGCRSCICMWCNLDYILYVLDMPVTDTVPSQSFLKAVQLTLSDVKLSSRMAKAFLKLCGQLCLMYGYHRWPCHMKGLSDLLFWWFAVRQKKAVAVFPQPTAGPLRPVVHSQTLKYNSKIRGGQGFTLEELKVCFYVAQKVPDFLGKWMLVLSPCQNLWSLLANDQLVVVLQKFSTWCFCPLSPRVEENCFDS